VSNAYFAFTTKSAWCSGSSDVGDSLTFSSVLYLQSLHQSLLTTETNIQNLRQFRFYMHLVFEYGIRAGQTDERTDRQTSKTRNAV